MAEKLKVTLEVGPKQKRVVAVATDWPGLERAAKSEEAAIEKLWSYLPRYAKVAKLARMGPELAAVSGFDVVERYPGTGSTDFWGISFAFSSLDGEPMSNQDLKRHVTLMRSCWKFFDDVRGRVSSEMQKGARGGGRDRDTIVRHVIVNEQREWAKKVGLPIPNEAVATDDAGVKTFRDAYCSAIRTFHSEGKMARNWPLRYLIRHTAYHAMDHSWEMEDKDMTDRSGQP